MWQFYRLLWNDIEGHDSNNFFVSEFVSRLSKFYRSNPMELIMPLICKDPNLHFSWTAVKNLLCALYKSSMFWMYRTWDQCWVFHNTKHNFPKNKNCKCYSRAEALGISPIRIQDKPQSAVFKVTQDKRGIGRARAEIFKEKLPWQKKVASFPT